MNYPPNHNIACKPVKSTQKESPVDWLVQGCQNMSISKLWMLGDDRSLTMISLFSLESMLASQTARSTQDIYNRTWQQ